MMTPEKMSGRTRARIGRSEASVAVLAALVLALASGRPAAAASPVPFSFDLYRPGTYSMQATSWWCTAASVEIMRNLVERDADHRASDQSRFFDYMHARDRYRMPAREGVDPAGFIAGLRRFVDPSYRLVASRTLDEAVRSAVRWLRLTQLPVALIVDAGRHAWVLTGFTASADPVTTDDYLVLSLRIVGPLYGRREVNGYDPPPDTQLVYSVFRTFLVPYHFKFGRTPWDGRYVTFQPGPAVPSPVRPGAL
jgi:hypothetical protein